MGIPKSTAVCVLWVFGSCVPTAYDEPWGVPPAATHFDEWQDPATYTSRSLVLEGLTLHYLDWGGRGEAMLFLAGGGQTAYVMGGLADRFKESNRVLALTRRGTGESSRTEDAYEIDDHAGDIVAFLDALGIGRATLVGHSMAGAEMTRVAELRPDLVHRLVYLDATYDYAGYAEMTGGNPYPRPSPRDFGWPTSVSLRDYNRVHVYGFWSDSLEADLRVSFWRQVDPKLTATFIESATDRPNNYSAVLAPALAFWARPSFDTFSPAQALTSTQEVRQAMEDYFRQARVPWSRAGIERFEREIANGRVIVVDANHHFFVPLEDMVVREIESFLRESS